MHFKTLERLELIPGALLASVEIHSAEGSSIDAQQTFLLAIANTRFDSL
jgi:hypothetical protein